MMDQPVPDVAVADAESSPDRAVHDFFAAFADASAVGDWARYGEMFLPHFMNADPSSVTTVSRDDLVAFLPHRKSLFESVGATGTTLASLRVQHLDDRHALAETTWTVEYLPDRTPSHVPVLHATFLLRLEDQWCVAVYLNHDDLPALLGLT